jgi:hypothetical protein
MTGGLAFVVRILGHEAYPVLFPSMLSILPELGRAALAPPWISRNDRSTVSAVVVVSSRGLHQAAPQFVLYPGSSRAKNNFRHDA